MFLFMSVAFFKEKKHYPHTKHLSKIRYAQKPNALPANQKGQNGRAK